MGRWTRWAGVVLAVLATACAAPQREPTAGPAGVEDLPRHLAPDPREVHFSELLMLTDGGENAEAYFSFDGRRLIFQATRPPHGCDQIFTMGVDGRDQRLLSSGRGRTTCAYFYPDGEHVALRLDPPRRRRLPAGPGPLPRLRLAPLRELRPVPGLPRRRRAGAADRRPGYNAEATVSPRRGADRLHLHRDGDIDLYSMDLDGSDVRRLTSGSGTTAGRTTPPTAGGSSAARTGPSGRRTRRLPGPARAGTRPPRPARNLGDGRGRRRSAAGHRPRRRQVRPVLPPPGRDHLLDESPAARGGGSSTSTWSTWTAAASSGSPQRGLRRLPDVVPGRQAARLLLQPRTRRPGETNVFVTRWRE